MTCDICNDDQFPAEIVAGKLPAWFEVLLRQRDMMLADGETRATAHGIWQRTARRLAER
jgi:hypothetical protein